MTSLRDRLHRTGSRICPPCDGDCLQGRDCPNPATHAARWAEPPAPRSSHELARRALADNYDLRLRNATLTRALDWAIAGLLIAIGLAAWCMSKVPW